MKKDMIKKLATASYSRDTLDEKKVNKISKLLKREELKAYIRSLKMIEDQKNVTIEVASSENLSGLKLHFSKLFPNKKISVKINDSLISGIKIVDYDNVYELSLKDILEKGTLGGQND